MFTVAELVRAAGAKLKQGNLKVRLSGVSIDTRNIKKGEAFIAIRGNNFDGHDFIREAIEKGAGCIIASKGKTAGRPAPGVVLIEVKDTVKALGDIARYNRLRFDIPVIAVTGSNGKTTTKEMIAWVLGKKFNVLKNDGTKNNHIGVALTLLKMTKEHDMVVVEIGTNHFGEIEYLAGIALPTIGVITNIGPSHLEHLRNVRGVFREKSSLMKKLQKPRLLILNADDALLGQLTKRHSAVLGVGMKGNYDYTVSCLRHGLKGVTFLVNGKYRYRLKTQAMCNIYNALNSIAAARIFGLTHEEIGERLTRFKFPQGRFSKVVYQNITFIDDTYNSNPLSFSSALEALEQLETKGRKIVVMGDMLELGAGKKKFHAEAGRYAARICDKFLTVGSLTEHAAEAARVEGLSLKNIFSCSTSLEARDILFNMIAPDAGDLVLVKGSRSMKMERVFPSNKKVKETPRHAI